MNTQKIILKSVAAFNEESERRYHALLPDLERSEIWKSRVDSSILGECLRTGNFGAASNLSTEYYFRVRTHQMGCIAAILNTFNGNDYLVLEIFKDLHSRNPGVFKESVNSYEITYKIFYELFKAYNKKYNLKYEQMPSFGTEVAFSTDSKNNSVYKWPGIVPNTELLFKKILQDSFDKINSTKIKNIKKLNWKDNVMSFGSCFAVNLNRMLNEKGINSEVVQINEQFNNTFEVAGLINKVATKKEKEFIEINKKLEKTKLIVLTLGVSTLFVDSQTGVPYSERDISHKIAEGKVIQKMLSEDESFNLLNKICEDLSQYCENIVITLSPVPLIRSTNKDSNILLDDIQSKLSLRRAIINVCGNNNNLFYWPSFEIIKWLGAHFGTFGKTDKDTRHVNDDVVELIVNCFIETFFQNKNNISN